MKKKSNTGAVVVIVILVMLLLFGGVLFYLNNKGYLSFDNNDKDISSNTSKSDDVSDNKDEEITHKNVSSITESELTDKYKEFVKGVYQADSYYIGNISNDNILDLIVLVGTSEADSRYLFYTYDETYKNNYDNGIIMIDTLSGSHASIYYDNGTIIDFSAHMDLYTTLEYKVENNRLVLINSTNGEKKPDEEYPAPSLDKQLKFESIN